jgi:hypothetical protein
VQELTLLAPGGGRVTVRLPADPPVASVAAGIRFAGGSYGTGFQIGPRGYHDFACTTVAPATTVARLVVHGREVVLAEAHDGQSSVATLIGAHHELMTVYAGPAPARERVFALFDSLRIEDRPEGMAVRPRAATLLDTLSEQVIVVVRDRGAISVPGPRQAAALLPGHAGARTRYGEVWKSRYPGGADGYAYLLGCPAGLAEVHLGAAGPSTLDTRLDWLDRIDIAWHAG